MPRIRFTQKVQAETEGRHKGPIYEVGTELDLSELSALRWLRRGVAVEVTSAMGRPQAGPKPEEPKAEPAPAAKAEEPKADDQPKRRGRKPKADDLWQHGRT